MSFQGASQYIKFTNRHVPHQVKISQVKVAGKLTCKVSFRFSKNNFLHTYKISAVSSMHSILSTYVLLNSTYALAETCM